MQEPRSEAAARLRSVQEVLADAAPDDTDALLNAGAILEGITCALPPDLPAVGRLLSVTLDALQAAYTGEIETGESLEAVREALSICADTLSAGGEQRAEAFNRAGSKLWALLGRDSCLSPFHEAENAEADPCVAFEREVQERLATLVSAGPEDVAELANLAAWLIERTEDRALSAEARPHALRASELLGEVLDGSAERPQQALDEAAAAIDAMTARPEKLRDSRSYELDSRNKDRDDAAAQGEAEPPDDAPACLQFEGDVLLLGEFVTESMEHIETAEAGMLAVEADPGDREAINAVFRGFHTIKGTAGFLGLAQIQALAHLAENLLDRAREGQLQLVGGYADLALASSDMLREMLEDLRDWQEGDLPAAPAGYQSLMQQLEAPDEVACDPTPAAPDADDCVKRSSERDAERRVGSARVRTDRLDALINMVGELVIANAMLAQDEELREAVSQEVERKIDQVSKITRELQDVSMSLRMVPLKGTFHKMARVVRDLARKSGKLIELVTDGEDTEIDRNMVESINDPLMHMVRNAADHGIEPPEERESTGKPPTGTVTLRAYHSAGSVVIEIADDGRGLDRDRIREKAVAAGEIEEGAQLADEEVCRLIFSAGLSTAREVTDVSGRGVGMDVVRRNIEEMRGRVDISSEPGRGSTFSMRIPLTLAIIDGMLMRVADERYILPTVSIQQAFSPRADDLRTLAAAAEMVRFRGEMIPLLRMHELFEIEREEAATEQSIAVVVEREGERFALLVDELLGQQQIVIKSLGEGLADAETVAGAAILGDGSVGLILDVDGLIRVARNVQRGEVGDGRCAA